MTEREERSQADICEPEEEECRNSEYDPEEDAEHLAGIKEYLENLEARWKMGLDEEGFGER